MIQEPAIRIKLREKTIADAMSAPSDEISQRVAAIVQRFQEYLRSTQPEVLTSTAIPWVEVTQAPTLHSGLGTGTQLALATTLALSAWYESDLSIPQCAMIAKRGRRSAVGTYGFYSGGLILDGGNTLDLKEEHPSRVLGTVRGRYNVPAEWRIVLMSPSKSSERVEGTEEETRFSECPAPDELLVEQLESLLEHELVPALEQANFESFAECVTRYNHDAGMLFAAVQGGPYHGPDITQLVQTIQGIGVYGVGQSSWGPTVFAICKDIEHAQGLVHALGNQVSASQIVEPLNRPASLS